MVVNNNFPDVDVVLRKLREYVEYFNKKLETATGEDRVDCEYYLKHVTDFIDAIANYLDSVCNAEIRIAKAKEQAQSMEDIRYFIEREDNIRTMNHSEIIRTMIMIDRTAARYGLDRVFDIAREFEKNFAELTPSTMAEKAEMSPTARIKRREMGNFGLYIGASITAGMSRDYMITDDEARNFANCEGEKQEADFVTQSKVRATIKKAKDNLNDIIEIS